MMLRRTAVIGLCCLSLASCQGSRKKVIAVIPKATSHLFWVNVERGAMTAGRDLGVEVVWNGPPSETEFSRQIQIFDSMIARRVDGIAVAAADRTALVQPIDRAAKAGIPVTVFDSGVESTNYLSFVSTNNYEAGQMGARKLAELLGGKGKIAVVLHAPGSYSTMERERGFKDVLGTEFPQMKIVAEQYGMSDRAKARAAAENMLAANPDLEGMFASSEPSSVGASLAIKARELAGKVKLIAFDSSEGMIEDLKGGAIHAMIVQDPYKIGYEAVRTLVDHLHGKPQAKRMDLSAQIVTRADLERPEIKKLLAPGS